jgi:PPOX class probable F420-dependent enzyme
MTVLPDETSPFGARVRTRLAEETVVWFTTVGNGGTPQPNPVWFLWQGDTVLIYNRPDAHRLRHIAARPAVTLNFDSDGGGGDIVVLSGTAEVVEDPTPARELPEYTAKYGDRLAKVSGSAEEFSATYSVAVRVTITGVRGF